MDPFAFNPMSMGSGIFGFVGQERTNAANAEQAARQIDFQREQSETVHQRAVKDLLAAGLNPILSATRGGNPAMSGAQATMGNSASSAIDAVRQRAEINNIQTQNDNIRADTDLKMSQRALNSINYNVSLKDEILRDQQAKTEKERTSSEFWTARSAQEAYQGDRVEGNIDRSEGGEASRWIRRFIPFFNSATGAARFRVR